VRLVRYRETSSIPAIAHGPRRNTLVLPELFRNVAGQDPLSGDAESPKREQRTSVGRSDASPRSGKGEKGGEGGREEEDRHGRPEISRGGRKSAVPATI